MNLQFFRNLIIITPILERLIGHLGVRGMSVLVCANRELLRYDNLPKGSASRLLLEKYFTNVYQEIIKFRAGKVVLIMSHDWNTLEYDLYMVNWGTPPPQGTIFPKVCPFSQRIINSYNSPSNFSSWHYDGYTSIYLARVLENPYRQNVLLEINKNGNMCNIEFSPHKIKKYTHNPNYRLPNHQPIGLCFYPSDPPSLRPPPIPQSRSFHSKQTPKEIADDHMMALQLAISEGYNPFM